MINCHVGMVCFVYSNAIFVKTCRGNLRSGTSGRTRTATPVKAGDFESPMSTNFITLALYIKYIFCNATVLNSGENYTSANC